MNLYVYIYKYNGTNDIINIIDKLMNNIDKYYPYYKLINIKNNNTIKNIFYIY